MSSTHLSRVLSPTLILMPSLFAVRVAPFLLSNESVVGVMGVGVPLDSAMEVLRAAGVGRKGSAVAKAICAIVETYEVPFPPLESNSCYWHLHDVVYRAQRHSSTS